MNLKLFLLFNHRITTAQETDARRSLQVGSIVNPPEEIGDLWRQVPPDLAALDDYLAPVKAWLAERAASGDYLLVQGDFGATYLMVDYAFSLGMIPVYSTTVRTVVKTHKEDGVVELTHAFKHNRFRRYKKSV